MLAMLICVLNLSFICWKVRIRSRNLVRSGFIGLIEFWELRVKVLDDSCLRIFWVDSRDYSEERKMMYVCGAS